VRIKLGFIFFTIAMLLGAQVQASHTVNFTSLMPPEFGFCGKKIGLDSEEYKSLYNWFNNNTTGWYESDADFELKIVFESATMRVNFLKNKVVVNSPSAGSTGQLVRAAKTAGFSRLCNK